MFYLPVFILTFQMFHELLRCWVVVDYGCIISVEAMQDGNIYFDQGPVLP